MVVIFLGCPIFPIQVQQALGDLLDCRPAMKDEVVAILHLREEQAVLTARLLAFPVADKRS